MSTTFLKVFDYFVETDRFRETETFHESDQFPEDFPETETIREIIAFTILITFLSASISGR